MDDSTLVTEAQYIANMVNKKTEFHTGPIVIHVIDKRDDFVDMGEIELPISFSFKIIPATYDEKTLFENLTTQLRSKLYDEQKLSSISSYVNSHLDSNPRKKINKENFLNLLDKKTATKIRTTFGEDGVLQRYLENNQNIIFDMVLFASCDDPELLFELLTYVYDTGEIKVNYTDTKEFDRMMDTSFTSRLKEGAYFLEIHEKKFVHFDHTGVSPEKMARRQPYLRYIESRFDKKEDGEDMYYQKKPSQGGGAHNYNKYKHDYNLLISRS